MPTTPLARTKTAALARVLDNVPKGYTRYTAGTVSSDKAKRLAERFQALYSIGATPAQRLTRKANGLPNALLVMYWPEDAERVEWLLLFTAGDVPGETLREATDKPRLCWLGYELVRRPDGNRTAWTWRRPREAMTELYALITEQLSRHHAGAVSDTLKRIANQPGFNGVRGQSWELIQFARERGYQGETPYLFFVQKVSHGDRMTIT